MDDQTTTDQDELTAEEWEAFIAAIEPHPDELASMIPLD